MGLKTLRMGVGSQTPNKPNNKYFAELQLEFWLGCRACDPLQADRRILKRTDKAVTAMNAGGRVHLKFGVMVAVLAGGTVKAA